jgi:aspartate oxidase
VDYIKEKKKKTNKQTNKQTNKTKQTKQNKKKKREIQKIVSNEYGISRKKEPANMVFEDKRK